MLKPPDYTCLDFAFHITLILLPEQENILEYYYPKIQGARKLLSQTAPSAYFVNEKNALLPSEMYHSKWNN